jgi:hypothetical protein
MLSPEATLISIYRFGFVTLIQSRFIRQFSEYSSDYRLFLFSNQPHKLGSHHLPSLLNSMTFPKTRKKPLRTLSTQPVCCYFYLMSLIRTRAHIQGRLQISKDLKQRQVGEEATKGQDLIRGMHKVGGSHERHHFLNSILWALGPDQFDSCPSKRYPQHA